MKVWLFVYVNHGATEDVNGVYSTPERAMEGAHEEYQLDRKEWKREEYNGYVTYKQGDGGCWAIYAMTVDE